MVRKHSHAEYMLNIDISFLRDVIFKDYNTSKKFLTFYVVYAFSEAMNHFLYKNNLSYNLVNNITMDEPELDNMFKMFCNSGNKQQLFQDVFSALLLYPEFKEFITYTSLHVETFSERIIDKFIRNIRYYDDKQIIINVTLVSINILSLTTKVVMK